MSPAPEETALNVCSVINRCRACGSAGLVNILDLGLHPLANALKKTAGEREPKHPLSLAFCSDCRLAQILETVRKELLFDRYYWVTGTSRGARDFAKIFFERTLQSAALKPGDLVVEIASNDGTFLKPFAAAGFRALGVDPAKNIAEIAQHDGVRTLPRYWDRTAAKEVAAEYGEPKVIFARNVIAHVEELSEVLCGISACLAPDGVGIVEFHYAGAIVNELQYDAIYHEHLCYFSAASMAALLPEFGLFPFHAESGPISGGACIMYFSKVRRDPDKTLAALLETERRSGLNELATWEAFGRQCLEHRDRTRELLRGYEGKTIVGYGTSARSSTYLNFCGVTRAEIGAVIDNNALKQGLFSPGSSIPIVGVEEGLALKPEALFILAWNFKAEIMADCDGRGFRGDYLIPFPRSPHILKSPKAA